MNHDKMLKPMLIAGAVLVVLGLAGVPIGNVGFLLFLLMCPLMMIFMMRGMDHGGGQSHDHDQHDHEDDRSRRRDTEDISEDR